MTFDKQDTKRWLAEHDQVFKKSCELAGVANTPRQYSRYRNHRGSAWAHKHKALRELHGDEK